MTAEDEIMPEFMNDAKTMSLEELKRKYQGPANVMFGIRRIISQLEAAWTRIEMLNATLKQEMDMEAKVQKLEAQLSAAKAALEFYGDPDNWEYTTHESTHDGCGVTDLEAMKNIVDGIYQSGGKRARAALSHLTDIEGASEVVEVGCCYDEERGWLAGEQTVVQDTHKGILIVKKRKEGGAG